MHIQITATSTSTPALFAHVVRQAILGGRPDARIEVRAIQAPAHRQFHTIQTDDEAAFLIDLLPDMLPMLRELAAEGEV